MKKIIAATVIALTTAAGAAHATLMTPKTVNYSCQGDQKHQRNLHLQQRRLANQSRKRVARQKTHHANQSEFV